MKFRKIPEACAVTLWSLLAFQSRSLALVLEGLIPEQLLPSDTGVEINLFFIGEQRNWPILKADFQLASSLKHHTIRIYQNLTVTSVHATNESCHFQDLLRRIYSLSEGELEHEELLDCSRIYTFIYPDAEKEFNTILKLIGNLEQERHFSQYATCSPTIFIAWPPAVDADADVGVGVGTPLDGLEKALGSIRTSAGTEDADTDWHFPYWSSNIYILLPQSTRTPALPELQLDVYELFSYSHAKENAVDDFILSQVTLDSGVGTLPKSRRNFMGNEVRVTAVGKEFFTNGQYKYFLKETDSDSLFKSLATIGSGEPVIEFLQASLNFCIKTVPADDWLTDPINDSWTGLAKILKDRLADLSVDQSTFIPFRAKYFTLLMPIFLDMPAIWFRQPPASSVYNIFLQPFSISLWMAIIGQCILGVVLLTLLVTAIGRSRNWSALINIEDKSESELLDNKGTEIHSHKTSIGSIALWFTSFMTIQGWYQVPEKTWLRIVFFSGSIMGFIFYTAYSATLVSQFASSAKPIKTLEDFIRSDFALYADKESAVARYALKDLLVSDSESHKILHVERAFAMNQTLGFENGVPFSSTSRSHSASITFTDQFYTYARNMLPETTADRLLCRELTEIPAMKVPFRSGMIVPKNSPLKEYFNLGIINYYEVGLFLRDFKEYVSNYRPTCDLEAANQRKLVETASNGLSLADTFTAFLIIAIGAGLALLVLIMEVIVSHSKL